MSKSQPQSENFLTHGPLIGDLIASEIALAGEELGRQPSWEDQLAIGELVNIMVATNSQEIQRIQAEDAEITRQTLGNITKKAAIPGLATIGVALALRHRRNVRGTFDV